MRWVPNTLQHIKPAPEYDVPEAFNNGGVGLPKISTAGATRVVVPAALAVAAVSNVVGFQPSKYRKMPCRAVSVNTVPLTSVRSL